MPPLLHDAAADPPCALSFAAVRAAFAKEEPAATQSLKQEGAAAVDQAIRHALELPEGTQRNLFGFRWATSVARGCGPGPDFEAVHDRVQARRDADVECVLEL